MQKPGAPDNLYGVIEYAEFSPDGAISSSTYIMGLDQSQIGMTRGAETILYFYDPAKRDEFHAIFGGTKVTLHRQPRKDRVLKDDEALAALRKMAS